MPTVKSIKKALRHKRQKEDPRVSKASHLSTGSTLFNLACSGTTYGGFKKGHYYHLVGDSSSGKTFFALTCLAEACINEAFDDYQLIHDDAESGNLFDSQKFWPVLVERLQPPRGDLENPECSTTVEDFWDNIIAALKRGPCVYVLDSEDVLAAVADIAKYEKQAKAREKRRKGEAAKEAGSYGTSKARENSGKFPMVMSLLKKTGSILIIISQTRDKIGQAFMSFGPEKTYSGGHALKFYATLQIWTSVKEHLKKRVNNKDREMGIRTQVRIKKNRQTGKDRKVSVCFYHSFGLDDVGSCIDYLVDERHWKEGQSGIRATEFDTTAKREELVAHIEEHGLEGRLRKIVKKVWTDIERQCTIQRKSKYVVKE